MSEYKPKLKNILKESGSMFYRPIKNFGLGTAEFSKGFADGFIAITLFYHTNSYLGRDFTENKLNKLPDCPSLKDPYEAGATLSMVSTFIVEPLAYLIAALTGNPEFLIVPASTQLGSLIYEKARKNLIKKHESLEEKTK